MPASPGARRLMATAVVGTRVRRLDALDKVTGRARYATELERPGMLQAAGLRSERPHAPVPRPDGSPAPAPAGPPDPGRSGNVCGRVLFERGDVERALAEAEVVLEETYVTRAVHQSPIEPHGGLAELGEDGRLTVWATTQAPFSLRARLAEAL